MNSNAGYYKPVGVINLLNYIVIYVLITLSLSCFAANCPDCGGMKVPYPLSTSSSCGDPRYKITCNTTENKLFFNAVSGSYQITSINGELERLVIRPASPIPGQCKASDFQSQGLVLNQSLPFNLTNTNTILLFNCTQLLLESPLNCSSNSLCAEFLAENSSYGGDVAPCNGLLCCTFKAGGSTSTFNIRVREEGCSAYTSVLNMDSSSRWEYGIEMEWMSPSEPLCNSESGLGVDACGQDSLCQQTLDTNNASQWRCLCKPNYHWGSSVGLCLKDEMQCQGSNNACNSESTDGKKMIVEAGIAVGLSVFILLSGSAAIVVCRRNIRARRLEQKVARERQEMLSTSSGGKAARLYTAKQMRRATLGFAKDRVIGLGGFGEVYHGCLDDGTEVAVKAAKVGNVKSTEQVLNEVRILSQVNHRNLVRLLGCCVETAQPLLVYEYIPNGTLADHLRGTSGRPFLEWPERLSIALQTAEGLSYLHSSAYPPIYHRDVKCSNILLDHQLQARVCDFGLSRLAELDATHISTCAQGTLGYLDPEYFRKLQLTDKSDVYSFGVVLFELGTSKKAIDLSRGQDDVNLAVLVVEKSEAGHLMELADRRLFIRAGHASAEIAASVEAVLNLGLHCTRESRAHRPTMREVVEELRAITASYSCLCT